MMPAMYDAPLAFAETESRLTMDVRSKRVSGPGSPNYS